MIDDLIAFQNARLDEDEAEARRNIEAGLRDDEKTGPGWPDYQTYDTDDIDRAYDYIRHFRPRRTLRQVEAGRTVLAEYVRALEKAPGNTPLINTLIRIIKAQAAVDEGHPDYREDWKP